MRRPAVPYLEAVAGGVWWLIGAAALSAGPGTVVLAAGLGVTGAIVVALRRRHGSGEPLPPGGRTKLLQVVIGAIVLITIASTLLGMVSFGELSVPLACAIVGGALFPLASLLDERSLLAAGGALLVLGAVGALLALDSGGLYPQGLVGLVAGGVLWLAAAMRTGLIAEAQGRVRR
ncbi:hypothetical protein [Pseudonocardia sp.]|jgi:hypothetical protein|uniref:hypothetical protein n=1 Tax=Pseudonocardia sp. TaxID=60912 RepID=UPI002628B84C|nr:hypothetical protein [Pseudonocardia sp.]MCW2720844.1 hypothetical protein [Pseudonocardia sp.]MDT7612932.1 hypothetical protein [Pseudonocardiales bacterium]